MGTDQQLRKSFFKKHQRKLSVTYPFQYILGEQRFVCLLVGIVIACVVFNVIPSHSPPPKGLVSAFDDSSFRVHRRVAYELDNGFSHLSAGSCLATRILNFAIASAVCFFLFLLGVY